MIRKLFALSLCVLLLGSFVHAQDANPTSSNTNSSPAYLALTTGDVYVEDGINGIDAQVLQQAATQSQDDPHTRVKIAILSALPSTYLAALNKAMARDRSLASKVQNHERDYYAFRLHKALDLDKTPLVLVVLQGTGFGTSVETTALSADARIQLAKQYAPAINANPQQGTAQLAQAVASEINGKEYRSSAGLWVVFFLVVAVIVGLIVAAGRKKRQQMAIARGPIETLRENVLNGIEYLDGYMDVLPKNNPDSDGTRSFRQAASAKYDQAVKILDRATEMTDLNRAQTLLDQAQADVQSARRSLDRATGGTGAIPGDDAMRPPPLPESQREVDAIPENQRGVSFFSGRPAPLSSLVPVTLTINGQSRQVLVTAEEADELRSGRMPQVRAFAQGGQSRPWYEYDNYDPYRDYWRYENSGWNGFGNGLIAGYIGAELLDSLTPNYGIPGYAPYAYATDTPMYQGYTDPNFGNTPDFATSGGGGDFFSNDGGNFDTQGFDPGDQGAGDFFSDNGGSDFGGGGDFGGGDSGGGGGDW